jgi:hypothetical protein
MTREEWRLAPMQHPVRHILVAELGEVGERHGA